MAAVLCGVVYLVPGYDAYRPVVMALSFLLVTTALDMHFVHVGTARLFSFNIAMTLIKIASFIAVMVAVQDEGDVVLFAVLNFGTNGVASLFSFVVNTRRFGFRLPSAGRLRARAR